MELALSLGDTHTPKPFSFLEKSLGKDLGFCMAAEKNNKSDAPDPPVQLDLLPFSPVQRSSLQPASNSNMFPFPWLTQKYLGGGGGGDSSPATGRKGEEGDDEGGASPNSAVSSFQMDFSIFRRKRDLERNNNNNNVEGAGEGEAERGGSSRGSDEEENGSARKKLRLSKEQSAFLEESFKEHNTLNPKQKVALAKQLNLRPRQVEVWFQNRRARTKLKQTEVDCEYLKRCCETLTEENRRLQKELQELRALKASQSHPFYMQLPATTLTMCPSCERVVTTAKPSSSMQSSSPPHPILNSF